MNRRRTIRVLFFTAIVLLLVSPFWLYDDKERLTVFAISVILIAYLWATSRRDTQSLLTLALNRIALAGFGLVALWGSLNPLRSFTYDDAVENRSPWNSVYWYTVDVQDVVIWCGIALAVIFFIVLLIGIIKRPHKTRSLQTRNV